jgi:hypothetical protein
MSLRHDNRYRSLPGFHRNYSPLKKCALMDLNEKMRFLTRRAFPDYRQLREPSTDSNPERDARVQLLKAFADQLKEMSLRELDERCIEEIRKEKLEQDEADERADQLAYFSQDDAAANFNAWCKLDGWSIDEATALLLGKDPSKVSWEGVRQFIFNSIFARTYQTLRNQLLRAQVDGKFADSGAPTKFVQWANDTGRPVPDGLNVLHSGNPDKKSDDFLSTRERGSVVKLIAGMAIKGYGYDSKLKKNAATQQIADHLAELGLSLSVDTVREYIKEGVQLIDQNRTEK